MQTDDSHLSMPVFKPEESQPSVTSPFRVDALVKQVYDSSTPKVKNRMLNLLVGRAYESSPLQVRKSLLEQLIRSVGILGLVTIAGGVFAKIRLRGGWPDIAVRMDDLQDIRTSDVVALVDYVQQVSVNAVDGLAHLLSASPVLTSSAAATLLITVLVQRARTRRAEDRDI